MQNPFRHTTKFAKVPIAFAGLKTDLLVIGTSKVATGDEIGTYLNKNHKGAYQSFEVNAFKNIGISSLMDWTAKEASRIYPAVEAAKFRGIDRYQKVVRVTQNQEWLDKRPDVEVEEAPQTQLENALWAKDQEMEEKSSFRLRDVCVIF